MLLMCRREQDMSWVSRQGNEKQRDVAWALLTMVGQGLSVMACTQSGPICPFAPLAHVFLVL